MFCPRCSQEQVSEETKFCSRCGFPLGLVSEILANGGFLPQLGELHKSKKLLTRRNGLFFALFWFMIFVLILAPLWGMAGVKELAAFCGLIGTMGGLIWLVASFAFLEKTPAKPEFLVQKSPNYLTNNYSPANRNELPPQQVQTAQDFVSPANLWKAPNTGDFVQPQSVTEGTTKLLKKDELIDN